MSPDSMPPLPLPRSQDFPRDDQGKLTHYFIESDTREYGALCARTHAAQLQERIEGLELDAARWRYVLTCTRMDNFGGFVIHPDDPVLFTSMVGEKLQREVDAAIRSAGVEGEMPK